MELVKNEDKMLSDWYKLLLVVALKCSFGGALCPDSMWTAGCTGTWLMYSQLKFMALIILTSRWSWESLAEMVLSNTKASSFSFSYNYRLSFLPFITPWSLWSRISWFTSVTFNTRESSLSLLSWHTWWPGNGSIGSEEFHKISGDVGVGCIYLTDSRLSWWSLGSRNINPLLAERHISKKALTLDLFCYTRCHFIIIYGQWWGAWWGA